MLLSRGYERSLCAIDALFERMLLLVSCSVWQLRHPNILAFKDSLEVQEKGQQVVYLVTEAVSPLSTLLKELDLSGKHRQVHCVAYVATCTRTAVFPQLFRHGALCMHTDLQMHTHGQTLGELAYAQC